MGGVELLRYILSQCIARATQQFAAELQELLLRSVRIMGIVPTMEVSDVRAA
jgi:hypothetical protein